MNLASRPFQPFDVGVMPPDDAFERIEPTLDQLLELGEFGFRRARVLGDGRDTGDHVFVEHVHVPVEVTDPGVELVDAPVELVKAIVDSVDPAVQAADVADKLIDPADLADQTRPQLILAGLQPVQAFFDAIEPLLGHHSLRPRDDDDTSSGRGGEGQSGGGRR